MLERFGSSGIQGRQGLAMFHSIRWRLIASFTLLTLLTVILLGVMSLTLMRRTLEQQVSDYLKANAEAVARQSEALLQPLPQTDQLFQLAHTAAFLGDAQVRILNDQSQVLVDSGLPVSQDVFTWIMQGPGGLAKPGEPPLIFALADGINALPAQPGLPPLPNEYTGTAAISANDLMLVRKLPGPVGDRLFFQRPLVTAGVVITQDVNVQDVNVQAMPIPTANAAAGQLVQTVSFARLPVQVTAPIQVNNAVVGYVQMTNPPNLVDATLAVMRQAFLLAAAVVTALAIGVGLVVSRGLTAPLAGLTQATRQMNSGDLTARAPVHGQDEIGLLAQQFNQMAAALERSFAALASERDALRRFIADASHELRTPLTALRTFNELLRGEAANDPPAQQEFLAESAGQIERLERITHNLLSLSRLDGGLLPLALAQHDLAELIRSVTTSLKPLAQEKNIELKLALPEQAALAQVDRSQIETVLSNLLDNALKFTASGGQVEIGVTATEAEVALWVKDNGCGIAPEEAAQIFERFHRGRHPDNQGSGLGLAIVRSIVQAHEGQVAVVSQPGVGSRFTVTLPVNPNVTA